MVVYVVAIKDLVSEAEPYIEFIGYHETEDQARKTIEFLKRNRKELVCPNSGVRSQAKNGGVYSMMRMNSILLHSKKAWLMSRFYEREQREDLKLF